MGGGCDTIPLIPILVQNEIYRTQDAEVTIMPQSILCGPWSVGRARTKGLITAHWGIRGPVSWGNQQATKFLHHKHRKYPRLYRCYAFIKESVRRMLRPAWQFIKKLLK